MRAQLPLQIAFATLFVLVSGTAQGQPDARQRQAAAEAYDHGTAAYLSGEYASAAQWFETANRMAPAAPALMQAVRAHQKAETLTRAATLALRLMEEYPEEPAANEYAQGVLTDLEPQFLRVDVTCDQNCRVDLDGTLQDFHSFYLEGGTAHRVTATFEDGQEVKQEVNGVAAEQKTLEFKAPPPRPDSSETTTDPDDPDDVPQTAAPSDDRKPLPPLVTFILGGVTVGAAGASVWSMIDMNSGVSDFEDAAKKANACAPPIDCTPLFDDAQQLLEDGQSKEDRTTIFWIATGGMAAITAGVAIFFTDWEGDPDDEDIAVGLVPTPDGVFGAVKGRF